MVPFSFQLARLGVYLITSAKRFSERIRELEVGNPGVGTPLDLIQQFYGLDATIHGFEQQR